MFDAWTKPQLSRTTTFSYHNRSLIELDLNTRLSSRSIAVAVESSHDHLVDRLVGHRRPSQIATSLGRQSGLQVAGTGLAMLRLPRTGQSEPLLGSFVSLHFGHDVTLSMPVPSWLTRAWGKEAK